MNTGEKPVVVKWKNLSFNEKLKLFNPWCIVIMIGNVFQFIGAFSVLFSHSISLSFNEFVIGFGWFLAWITLLRFFDTDKKYYSAPRAIRAAIPVIFSTLVGIVPIFIGFSFLGMCLFWKSNNFSTPGETLFTLFSMMFGDVIRETYSDVSFEKYLGNIFFKIFHINSFI